MTHSYSAASALSRLALIGRGAFFLLPRVPAALFVVHNQHQMFRHGSAMGSAAGQCRVEAPAVADHLQDWPRKRAGTVTRCRLSRPAHGFLITRGGLRARPAFHHFDFRTQPTWQGIADVRPSHFQKTPSVSVSMLNSYRNARTTNWVSRTK